MELIGIILSTIFISNSIICFIKWGINKIKISNKDKKQMEQIVYKVEKGDLVGDITGENVTIVLMQGDIKGNVNAGNGEIFLARGNINGDIKADKVVCPQPKTEYEEYIDKLSDVEKLSKPDKEEDEKHCHRFIDKDEVMKKIKQSPTQPPPDYVNCADCAYGEEYNTTPNGFEYYKYYKCSKFDGVIRSEGARICDSFKQKEHRTCKSCYHFVKDINGWFYCSKHYLEKLYDSDKYCPLYDGTGETTNYKSDCARFSNDSGICFSFHVLGCPIKNNCPDKIERRD